jgi:hypothetical protein
MKISTGMAEFGIRSAEAKRPAEGGKVYLWPTYHEGRVDRVDKITREPSPITYFKKTTEEERRDIISDFQRNSHTDYYGGGIAGARSRAIQPGMLFDVLV